MDAAHDLMETDAKDQGRAARDAGGGCPQYAAPTQAPTRAHAYSQGEEGSPLTSVWRALIKRRTVPSSPPVPWASIGDRETGRAPAQITQGVAPCWDGVVSSTYHHFKNVLDAAARLRKEARGVPAGIEREQILQKARQAEAALRIDR